MSRRLLESMAIPAELQVNPVMVAESVSEAFPVMSIVGGRGEQELRFVSPATLVVVISATAVECYDEPLPPPEEDEDFAEDEEDEDPRSTAEDILGHVSELLGLEEEEESPDEPTPDDAADRRAAAIVAALLQDGLLELVTPRSRPQVEGRLAHLLAHGMHDAGALAESIADLSGVAEFYADDAQMAAVLAKVRRGG
ncbi:hypothetical protein OV203_42460 [Nannocystis sp. ILAH1]|uniref:hypothetical protein n=1 Tax=unclassified Nannocystis TaxID=2627009 RepID=UPI00226EAA33|nr:MULTISPECIES: hypothetical protein [unclassified Nannocystis]MCY0993878.1 hypothetical protein [Nannocystis sp. ILAH1]MCY1065758.1 hypothetical protein [Nannocystis sp. RBIL2]